MLALLCLAHIDLGHLFVTVMDVLSICHQGVLTQVFYLFQGGERQVFLWFLYMTALERADHKYLLPLWAEGALIVCLNGPTSHKIDAAALMQHPAITRRLLCGRGCLEPVIREGT